MKTINVFILALALLVLAGCGDPKIDVSTDETMKTSIEKVRKSLPESQRKEFDKALMELAFNQIELKDFLSQGGKDTEAFKGKVRQSLDGKTGEQVIFYAERIQTERKERERLQALEEIRELEAKQAISEKAREELKKFKVVRSRFYLQERQYIGSQPIIELTVQNGTDKAISRAYFEGTLASPNRSIPWHKGGFNYSISGGLEPGERATWNLAPNMFSDWGKVNAPPDAVFTVEVERLDGPDGQVIHSTKEFGERDRERLKELKKKYNVE